MGGAVSAQPVLPFVTPHSLLLQPPLPLTQSLSQAELGSLLCKHLGTVAGYTRETPACQRLGPVTLPNSVHMGSLKNALWVFVVVVIFF